MSNDSSEEKTLPPSRQKLRKQREKGNVVTSKETMTSAVSIVALLYLYYRRGPIGENMAALFVLEPAFEGQDFAMMMDAKLTIVTSLALDLLLPFMALTSAVAIFVGMVISGGPVFSMEAINPTFDKINPASGFKKIFGRKAFMSFLMHVIRLAALSIIFGMVLVGGWSAMIRAPVCGLGCAAEAFEASMKPMVVAACVVMAVMALFDYMVQRAEFMREQRMSLSEYKREVKDQEGDALLKSQMRADQRDMLTTPTGAKQAVLVIDDSPDLVIGIRYVENETPAPLIVAKARGAIAGKQLMKAARAVEVRDSALARDLAKMAVGSYIVDDAMINRLAPLLQRAIMEQRR